MASARSTRAAGAVWAGQGRFLRRSTARSSAALLLPICSRCRWRNAQNHITHHAPRCLVPGALCVPWGCGRQYTPRDPDRARFIALASAGAFWAARCREPDDAADSPEPLPADSAALIRDVAPAAPSIPGLLGASGGAEE